jgi:hypothetical protein
MLAVPTAMAMQLHKRTDHFGNVASSNVTVANEAVVKQVPYIFAFNCKSVAKHRQV